MALHWSRRQEQVAKDAEFLRAAGLIFENAPAEFSKLKLSAKKENLVNLLMEKEFEGASSLEHKQAQEFWETNLKELRGA